MIASEILMLMGSMVISRLKGPISRSVRLNSDSEIVTLLIWIIYTAIYRQKVG